MLDRSPIRLLAALAVFLVVWEVCARFDETWTEGAPFLGRYEFSGLLAADEFGIRGRPHARFSKWTMNSLGFRGEELRPGTQRLLCIGASETFGMYEPEGLEFPRQLETELNRRAGSPVFQVVNAGLPGQSLSSFNRRAAAVVRQVQPTFAILYPSLAIYIDPPAEDSVPAALPEPPLLQPRLLSKMLAIWSDRAPVAVQTAARRLAIRAQTRGRAVHQRIPEPNVQRFRRDLSRLLDVLARERVPAVLVTHATRFGTSAPDPNDPMLIAWRALYPLLEESGFLDMENRLNAVIRNEAAARRLVLVDAAPLLRGSEHFVEFVHFTPAGAGALAAAIAGALPVQPGRRTDLVARGDP